MRRTTITIVYWTLSVLIVALILKFASDLGFAKALFIGVMFLPGALAAKYMLPSVSFKKRGEGIRNIIYICLAILVMEYLILVASYSYILSPGARFVGGWQAHNALWFPVYTGLMNPLVITVIVSALAIGGSLIDRWLTRNHPEMESPITFCSDRKRVSLLPSQMLYIESCDTEVYIHTTDGRKLRNKTGISQWESALGYPFVRVHRAFLINCNHVESYNQDTIKVGDEELPVSRKYQKDLKELFPAS
jgi:hypothetical protein